MWDISSKYAMAYSNRGATYGKLGNHKQAIGDYKAAARLGDKDAQDLVRSKGNSW